MAAKAQKVKWNQYAIEDDIKFRGPLNYRHFKIIGWALFVLKILTAPLKMASNLSVDLKGTLALPLSILEIITPLSVFFLLMASMSQLLVKGNYKKQMITNGGGALAIILIFELLYHRYFVGTIDAFVGDRFATLQLINAVFSAANPVGFMTFNVFLDIFLCTCVMFFLNYTPEKRFQGDKIKWFRALALVPVIYELVCLVLKLMANSGDYHMPLSFFPFLTAKPPMMFFVFCIMVIRQMRLEKRFCQGGRTHEEFEAYLDTNRGTFQFAKFAAALCLLAGIVDLIIVFSAIIGELNASTGMLQTMTDEAKDIWFNNMVNKYANAGFGGSADLIFFAPIMLLFNYRKTYENTKIEIAIPLGAIAVLVVIVLEAGLFGIGKVGEITRNEILPQIEGMLSVLGESSAEGAEDGAEDFNIEELIGLLASLEGEEEAPAEEPGTEVAAPEEQPAEVAPEELPAEEQQQEQAAA